MSENESDLLNEIKKQLEMIFIGDGLIFLVEYDFDNKVIIKICGQNKTSYISLIELLKISSIGLIKSITFERVNFKFDANMMRRFLIVLSRDYQEEINKNLLLLMDEKLCININLNFNRCIFDKIKEGNDKIGIVSFINIKFENQVCFADCNISDELQFNCIDFSNLLISECNINQNVIFNNVVFNNSPYFKLKYSELNMTFDNVMFKNDLNCYTCGLKDLIGVLSFKNINFINTISFDRMAWSEELKEFKCKLVMKNIIFEQDMIFHDIKFRYGVELRYLEFKKRAVFLEHFFKYNYKNKIYFYYFTFYENVNFLVISNFWEFDIWISKCTFKKSFVIPNYAEMCKKIEIKNTVFNGRVEFKNIKFNNNFTVENCVFDKELFFSNAKFLKNDRDTNSFEFIENNVKDNIDFSSVSFEISPNFQSSIFEKLVILYKTKFKEIPNFYSASFSSSAVLDIPLVDIKDYSFNHLKDEIKNKNGLIDIKGVRECLNIFKNALLKTSNILEASKYKVLELYVKELELNYKLEHTKELEEKITIKERFDRWFLKLNRATSDHHTDFLKIFLFTLSVIGGYFMINFGLSSEIVASNFDDLAGKAQPIENYIKMICKLFDLKIFAFSTLCVLCFIVYITLVFTFIKFKKLLGILGIFGIISIVSSPNIITPFLGVFSEDARNHYLYKAIDELDSQKALELSKQILAKEPTSELNAKKTLKDYKDELKSSKLLNESLELKRAVAIDGGVSRLNIAYYLVLAFCIFALQKTMRKNSIIPS